MTMYGARSTPEATVVSGGHLSEEEADVASSRC